MFLHRATLILLSGTISVLLGTTKSSIVMSFIIVILCFFGWLGEALHDGANIK